MTDLFQTVIVILNSFQDPYLHKGVDAETSYSFTPVRSLYYEGTNESGSSYNSP
jgi:hypothetical protein